MRCSSCGRQMEEGEMICSGCGVRQKVSSPEPEQNSSAKINLYASSGLKMGILSLIFFEIMILGLIFGLVGRIRAAQAAKIAGGYFGKTKAAHKLSTLGFVFSIIFTIGELGLIIAALVARANGHL